MVTLLKSNAALRDTNNLYKHLPSSPVDPLSSLVSVACSTSIVSSVFSSVFASFSESLDLSIIRNTISLSQNVTLDGIIRINYLYLLFGCLIPLEDKPPVAMAIGIGAVFLTAWTTLFKNCWVADS